MKHVVSDVTHVVGTGIIGISGRGGSSSCSDNDAWSCRGDSSLTLGSWSCRLLYCVTFTGNNYGSCESPWQRESADDGDGGVSDA